MSWLPHAVWWWSALQTAAFWPSKLHHCHRRGLLTLGIVSSDHGQLVTLLPSGPSSQASCRSLALGLIAAHFDKLLILRHHKALLSQALFTPSHLHTGGPQFKGNKARFYLIAVPYVWIYPSRGLSSDSCIESLHLCRGSTRKSPERLNCVQNGYASLTWHGIMTSDTTCINSLIRSHMPESVGGK